jgi:tetratricopeptide (TPR) repeat protein
MKPDQTDPIHTLDPDHLLRLGECVRDLIILLGYGYSASDLENRLFREAIAEAISILTSRQHMREFWRERQANALPDVSPISMEYLAQTVIDRAFSDGISPPPPEQEQLACINVALSLDPTCSDAYLIQGTIAEGNGDYEQARGAYEKAMILSATKLGPDVFEESRRSEQEFHFWYSDGSRPYMRSRAALAYLLWRKMGLLQEAIAHFQAMLTLNPGDNQGNRYALLCCLLEAGDDEALETALSTHRTYTDESGETIEIADTCWYYTHACWQFRHQPPPSDDPLIGEATKALRQAFKYNKHVPRLLLNPDERVASSRLGTYAPGDESEAAWYVDFSQKGWKQTPGAMAWLEAVARQARLLPTRKRREVNRRRG